MENLPERIKKALFDKGWSQKKLCGEIEITENGFKSMLETGSMKISTLQRISEAMDIPLSFFLDETPTKNTSNPSQYLLDKLNDIELMFKEFREQITVKDQQIAGLQRTVDVLLGKSEGVIIRPLYTNEVEELAIA